MKNIFNAIKEHGRQERFLKIFKVIQQRVGDERIS